MVGRVPRSNIFAGRKLDCLLPASDLYGCRECNLYFKFPQMSKQELDRLYEKGESTNWQYSAETRNDWRLAQKWIGDEPDARSILDIGCFDGQFLSSMVTEAARFGVEVHEEAASLAESRGINIVGRDFSKLDDLEMRFDVVIATDVIEHVNNPLQFLESMARITSDNGLVIVSTGNVDSFIWRFMDCRYWYCTIAGHLSFLSPEFCRQAAGKLGLTVERWIIFHITTWPGMSRSVKRSKMVL